MISPAPLHEVAISVGIPLLTLIAILVTQIVIEGSVPTSAHFLLGPRLAVTAVILCLSTTFLELNDHLEALSVSATRPSSSHVPYVHNLKMIMEMKLVAILGAIFVYFGQMFTHYQHYQKIAFQHPVSLAIYGTTVGFLWLALAIYVARLSPGA